MKRWRCLLVALVLGATAATAAARTEKVVDYRAEKVWPTAVRFLRVDAGAKIVDKDPDAGYVVFEIVDDGKTYTGALEVVGADDEQGPRVRLVMTIADRPAYVETVMLDRLERKLRADHGTPAPRKPPPKKAPEKPSKQPKQPEPGSPPSAPPSAPPPSKDDKPSGPGASPSGPRES